MRLLLLCFVCKVLFGYQDEELDQLWNRIPDIYHPRLEDFKLIEDYISNGKRPYLDALRHAERDACKEIRLNRILNFKMVGLNDEMPLFEVHRLNESEETRDRCVLVFGSHNGKDKPYAEYARNAVIELERIGYSGDVLLRIGGFPNIHQGSLKYSHVPYAFKVAFFQEAKSMGYKEILWIDCEIHPVRDLEFIFDKIKKNGYFFITAGSLQMHASHFPKEITEQLGIPEYCYPSIPHIAATVIGLDMNSRRAVQFLDTWLSETETVLPNIAFFPEELGLSLVAAQFEFQPYFTFGDILCIGHEIRRLNVFRDRPNLQFYVGNLPN